MTQPFEILTRLKGKLFSEIELPFDKCHLISIYVYIYTFIYVTADSSQK